MKYLPSHETLDGLVSQAESVGSIGFDAGQVQGVPLNLFLAHCHLRWYSTTVQYDKETEEAETFNMKNASGTVTLTKMRGKKS